MSTQVRRLFEQFQPENYKIELTPDAESLQFHGSVTITGKKVGRPSERITFHQKELSIIAATITRHDKSGSTSLPVSRINNQDSYDEVRIHADEMLYPGTYTITMDFEGTITKPMHGLYPCYFNKDGEEKILLATQFESHHAREVFPCIDEPEAKAMFDLTLTTPTALQTIANTPVLSTNSISDELTETVFETTPIMSTYLLAFAIGDIHCVEATTNDGVLVRTWATTAQPVESMQYANDEAVKILEFFTEYFQKPFPLKKCDQIALPDFESGAMENWGLITYREIALLTDPSNRSISSEQYVSMVVGHELSHQWFGNLVTMKWWDDLWLNESFASLMEHIALDSLHPDWNQWEQYAASDVISCSSRDVFKDVQSVHVDVKHPDEISTLFDPAIVYAKGGRLLKMMREYIGEDAFKQALKSYFTKHAYKNTIGDDLWLEMSDASGKDIKAFMDPWLDQSGMPLLEVSQTESLIRVSQKRYVLDSDNDASQWPVPYLADQPLPNDLLTKPTDELSNTANTPVIFNVNGSGHMLVRYSDEPTREYIANAFSNQTLQPESRVNIMNDLLLLARGNVAPLIDSLDIAFKSGSEERDAVWLIMSRAIGIAMGLVEGDEVTEKNIKQKRLDLVTDWYDKLGWDDKDNESPNTINLRHTILSLAIASEHDAALQEAAKRFNAAKNVTNLPAEQRGLIIGALVKKGEPIVDQLIEEYKTTANADIQLSICAGLTSVKDPEVAAHIIEQAIGENGFVRSQDIFRWYAYLMRNRYTRSLAWQWLKVNWTRLETLFGDSKSFEYFVVYSAAPINTVEGQEQFKQFFTPMSEVVALRRNIAVALSEIQTRVQWRKREEPVIKAYFAA